MLTACDWVLSRDEHDANGELVWRRVLRRFVRQSLVLNLHVRGQLIGTTAEHPFFVSGAGWTPAHSLRIGDVLLSHDGQHITVDGVADSGRIETVYNVEVEHDHTYFVGCDQTWGWSVWAHNRYIELKEYFESLGMFGKKPGQVSKHTLETAMKILQRDGDEAFHNYIMGKMGKKADAIIAEGAWDAAMSERITPMPAKHTRDGEYPKKVNPDVAEAVLNAAEVPGTDGQKLLAADGSIIDRSVATIDHRNPTVLDHWNTIGYDSPRSVRNAYFNNPAHMVVLSRSANSAAGRQMQLNGQVMRQDAGSNYSRYVKDEQ